MARLAADSKHYCVTVIAAEAATGDKVISLSLWDLPKGEGDSGDGVFAAQFRGG